MWGKCSEQKCPSSNSALQVAVLLYAGCPVGFGAQRSPDIFTQHQFAALAAIVCAVARLQGLSIWIAHLETPSGTLASPFGNYTAVLPLGITPLLPQLALVILVPTLLAAAAARLRLPPVLLTAASAGKSLLVGHAVGTCDGGMEDMCGLPTGE